MRGIRKLASVSCGFSAAVFLAHYLLPDYALYLSAAVCVFIAAVCRLLRNKELRLRLCLVLVSAALGFCVYVLNYDFRILPIEPYYDTEMTVSARVKDYPEPLDYCAKLYVRITDKRFCGANAVVYDYDNCTDGLRPGDEVNITLKVRSATEKYEAKTDVNISKNLYVVGYAEDCEKTGHWKYSFLYFPKALGAAIRETVREVFPEDTEAYMLALLTGYKTDYYDDDSLNASMSLAGMSHVVAVSGMHVAFLVGFIMLIAGKNRKTSLVCILLIWVFVVMVGAPPSAVRAGFMQSLLLLAPIFKRENDFITSLSTALALILLQNPFAAGSIGLQLSFAAMAGILLFGGRIYAWFNERCDFRGFFGGILHYAVGALVSSLAVTVFTWPLLAVHFGYVSLFSPIVNILCLWAVSVLFCGGYMICAIAAVFLPLAHALGGVLSVLVRYIFFVIRCNARFPLAALYTENIPSLCWMALLYITLTLYFTVGRKKKFSFAVPVLIAVGSFALILGINKAVMLGDKGTVAAMNVGNGECIAVTEGRNSVIIDCGAWNTYDNAGKLASSYLHANGRHKVDCLVLTHLHRDHANGVVWLMTVCDVKTLVLPADTLTEGNDELKEKILSAAERNGIQVVYISEDTELSAGNISLSIYAPIEKGDKNERGITMTASVNGYDTLILGDVNKAVERALVKEKELEGTELLFVAHHGSKYSTSKQLLEETRPDTAIISVGYNSYGHPTQEVLDTLAEYGVEVRRTDEEGRIVIRTYG